ncbi:MAG TPA: acetate uptake transporter [Candidatus Limnocylindrales bacterium]|nr:acetate uptake transporter [Candidatus Limnocylindrales bacterium]
MPEHDTVRPTVAPVSIADPGPLGLAGFALTTFVLSGHNANFIPDLTWLSLALFYGGLAQFCAGMWEFRRGNTFASTAFSTYGAFWLSLAGFILLVLFGKIDPKVININNAAGWFLFAFFIFNTYMLIASTRVNVAVFGVFLTLELTEIVDAIAFWSGSTPGQGWFLLGGWLGIITAAVAWYASAAGVINSLTARPMAWVGTALWNPAGVGAAAASPAGALPRR